MVLEGVGEHGQVIDGPGVQLGLPLQGVVAGPHLVQLVGVLKAAGVDDLGLHQLIQAGPDPGGDHRVALLAVAGRSGMTSKVTDSLELGPLESTQPAELPKSQGSSHGWEKREAKKKAGRVSVDVLTEHSINNPTRRILRSAARPTPKGPMMAEGPRTWKI